MRRRSLLGAATALLLLLAPAGCGSKEGDSEADIKREISETLRQENDKYDKAAADCHAELIIDEVGLEELKDVDLSDDEPPAELAEQLATAAFRAIDDCDLAADGG